MVLGGDRTPPLSCLRPPTVPKAYQIPANIPVGFSNTSCSRILKRSAGATRPHGGGSSRVPIPQWSAIQKEST